MKKIIALVVFMMTISCCYNKCECDDGGCNYSCEGPSQHIVCAQHPTDAGPLPAEKPVDK